MLLAKYYFQRYFRHKTALISSQLARGYPNDRPRSMCSRPGPPSPAPKEEAEDALFSPAHDEFEDSDLEPIACCGGPNTPKVRH